MKIKISTEYCVSDTTPFIHQNDTLLEACAKLLLLSFSYTVF